MRENRFIPNSWHAPEEYPLAAEHRGYGPNTTPVPDRWRNTGFVSWRRYTAGDTNELPYYHPKPERWHYYRQSVLKGDLPVRGQDLLHPLRHLVHRVTRGDFHQSALRGAAQAAQHGQELGERDIAGRMVRARALGHPGKFLPEGGRSGSGRLVF